jgi:Cu(I)/Ag(I) efflux system membrane fusion protein
MDLTPVTREEVRDGVIRLDHDRRQLIGVRMAKVERRSLAKQIHAVGEITYDETRIADVTLKYRGWIERLMVDETGQRVRRGQPLLSVYSPELYAAQQDYLLALRQVETARTGEGRERLQSLADAARARLALLDMTDAQLRALADRGEPQREVTLAAPASGFVVDKSVVDGAAVGAGERLYRIADLDRVWVEAEVYEQDIPLIRVGQRALVTLSHLPGKRIEGTVGFVYPYLHDKTRTARLRIELPNPELALKPDMYAEVDIAVDLGERLVVPESAIIYSGPRRLVFVDIGDDRFKPVVVETGVKSGSFFEVLSGLEEGDEVVISGNFLVTAESRLKSATGLW